MTTKKLKAVKPPKKRSKRVVYKHHGCDYGIQYGVPEMVCKNCCRNFKNQLKPTNHDGRG